MLHLYIVWLPDWNPTSTHTAWAMMSSSLYPLTGCLAGTQGVSVSLDNCQFKCMSQSRTNNFEIFMCLPVMPSILPLSQRLPPIITQCMVMAVVRDIKVTKNLYHMACIQISVKSSSNQLNLGSWHKTGLCKNILQFSCCNFSYGGNTKARQPRVTCT